MNDQRIQASNPALVFWFSLDKHQVPTKATLSHPLLSWTGERKYDERLMLWVCVARFW